MFRFLGSFTLRLLAFVLLCGMQTSFAQELSPTPTGGVKTTIDFTTPGLPLSNSQLYSVNNTGFAFNAELFNCSTPQVGCANTNISDVQGAAFLALTAKNFVNSAGQISAYTLNDIAIDYVQAPPSMTPYGPFTINIGAQDNVSSSGQYITTPLQCTSSIGTITTLDTHNVIVAIQQSDITEQTVLIHCSQPIWSIYFGLEDGVNTSGTSGFLLGPYVLMKSISFTLYPPSVVSGLQLVATTLDANEKPSGSPIQSSVTNGSTVTLALGGLTSFQLQDSNGNPIPATYDLTQSPTFDEDAPPVDVVNGLYLDQLALIFNSGVSTQAQEIMPIHLGSQSLTITPSNTQYPPFTISLVVDRPSAVGSGVYDCTYTTATGVVMDTDYANCDELIIDKAHEKGLPPQFIKAEMWQESYNHTFAKNSFRYEPLYDLAKTAIQLNTVKQVYEPEQSRLYNNYYLMS